VGSRFARGRALALRATLVLVVGGCTAAPAAVPVRPSGSAASETSPTNAPTATIGEAPTTVAPLPTPTSAPEPVSPTVEPTAGFGIAPIGATERAVVIRVVDGDTIVVDRGFGDERVRYIGVDTPETVDPRQPVQWMGAEASQANKRLVEGREVVLELDISETDRFDRLLRYVWLEDGDSGGGWLLVNLRLVDDGFAQVVTYPPDVRYTDLFLAAQRGAREAGRGLWGYPPEPTEAPGVDPPDDGCDPSYPGVCIRRPPPDLDCAEVSFRNFAVRAPDPHRFDGDGDGVGCET
jgi:micrococcal nuclease